MSATEDKAAVQLNDERFEFLLATSPIDVRRQVRGINRIGVMENDRQARKTTIEVIEQAGSHAVVLRDRREAIRHAEQEDLKAFILDIRMGEGEGSAQEGLDTLEILKEIDPNITVAVVSAYPETYRVMAERLGVDIFVEKSGDQAGDVRRAVHGLLEALQKKIETAKREVGGEAARPAEPARYFAHRDTDWLAFKERMEDADWCQRNQGSYVLFVDGKLVYHDKDRAKVLDIARRQHPQPRWYVDRVEAETKIEILCPLAVG